MTSINEDKYFRTMKTGSSSYDYAPLILIRVKVDNLPGHIFNMSDQTYGHIFTFFGASEILQ